MRLFRHLTALIPILLCGILDIASADAPQAAASIRVPVHTGWVDGSSAGQKPKWKATGESVSLQFPVISKGWFNFYRPLVGEKWPARCTRVSFFAKAEPAGRFRIRLNEMPGAASGDHDLHSEFEGHYAVFEASKNWRRFSVDLSQFRLLWRHANGNGQIDLDRVTSIGFEPDDTSGPHRLELKQLVIERGTERPTSWREHAECRFRIAFNSDRDGDYEIYAMDADGRNLDRLTHDPHYDLWPAPSPDGRRIAWMTNRDGNYEIYVMQANGTNPVNVTKHPESEEGHPTWSPDGKTIAFTSDRDGDMELYLMNADGSNWRRLTHSKGSDGLPSFSPDGKQIVFVSERSGDHELYTINSDGSGLKRLTRSKGIDTMPAWSPDGKTIAFVSARDGDQALFLLDIASGRCRRLSGMRSFDAWPDWSPDGRSLVYHCMRDGHFTVCVLDVETGAVEFLTRGRGSNRNPRFFRLAEETVSMPSIPPQGLRLVADVKGYLTSGYKGPNPQKYPFQYRGFSILTSEDESALTEAATVTPELARKIGQALLWPGVGDELESIQLDVRDGRISGHAVVLHRYGKQGTHTIRLAIQGRIRDGQLASLKAVRPSISGTWDWGGGIAKQQGKVEIVFAIERSGRGNEHAPVGSHKTSRSSRKPAVTPPAGNGIAVTAKVSGYTKASRFNPRKYPFKYVGRTVLSAADIQSLGRKGAVPEATARKLASCLIWTKGKDKIDAVKLTSDGARFKGTVKVTHFYGRQGKHTLTVNLNGSIADGQLGLEADKVQVSGSWSWGGGSIRLIGEARIDFEVSTKKK